jgi:Flp pilus assembly protein TadG
MAGRFRQLLDNRRAATALEFGVLLPVFMTMMFGIVEMSRAIWIQGVLQYAAEQGARCGVVATTGCTSTSGVQSFAATFGDGIPLTTSNIVVNATASCGYQVTANYTFTTIVRPLINYSWPLTSTSCRPI